MNRPIVQIVVMAAIAVVATSLTGCRTGSCGGECDSPTPARTGGGFPPDYPLYNRTANEKEPVTFDLGAKVPHGAKSIWFFNGSLIDSNSAPYLGVSDYDTPKLTIRNVSLANCGFYSYESEETSVVDHANVYKDKLSAVAELQVTSTPRFDLTNAIGVPIVVSGIPIGGHGGTGTKCPGTYLGYVTYLNANDPSGGWYFRNGGQAFDPTNPGNTVVYYYGVPATNWGCGNIIPKSPYPYHFRIYFKTSMPTGPYSLDFLMN